MPVDAALARRLVAAQLPQWAHLPVVPVEPGGVDNRTFRLGDELVVRLPSDAAYAPQVAKEQRWLPVLAPSLPLPIPEPVAHGAPGCGFPHPWSVYRWLPGEPATRAPIGDPIALAGALGEFLAALNRMDPAGAPAPGKHNFLRGGPLSAYAAETERAIATVRGEIDATAAGRVWAEATATTWDRAPVWFHGDVAPGNLLVRGGRLSAVIDFGLCGAGDPACDLAVAWTLFTGTARARLREAAGADEATWARGRGWALWKALITLAGGGDRSSSRRQLAAIVAD